MTPILAYHLTFSIKLPPIELSCLTPISTYHLTFSIKLPPIELSCLKSRLIKNLDHAKRKKSRRKSQRTVKR